MRFSLYSFSTHSLSHFPPYPPQGSRKEIKNLTLSSLFGHPPLYLLSSFPPPCGISSYPLAPTVSHYHVLLRQHAYTTPSRFSSPLFFFLYLYVISDRSLFDVHCFGIVTSVGRAALMTTSPKATPWCQPPVHKRAEGGKARSYARMRVNSGGSGGVSP